MIRGLRYAVAAAALSLMVSAAWAQDRPRIVVVNQVLSDFAERLVEDAADVVFPMPEDVDPSFWRPSIADISMIQSADMILLNGAGFATWIDRVSLPRARVVNTSAAIEDQFIVTESITHSHGDGGEHSHEGLASYTWLDPTLAIAQAESIAAALLARGLVPEADVAARLDDLRADLTALDAEAQQALDGLDEVAMIATHPRYQYFARRYGLTVASLDWDVGAMPNEEQLADLERLSNELGARILIWEAQPPQGAIEAANALGLHSIVFEPWANQGPQDSFISAFRNAIAELAETAG